MDISPDDTLVVYDSPQTGHGDIYLANSDGSNVRRLTYSPEYEGTPAFSPDGQTIIFTREEHYCGHLWIMNVDGSGQRQLTHGSSYDSDPCFTPDGQHIWFGRTPKGTRTVSVFSTPIHKDDPTEVNIHGARIVPEVSFTKEGDWLYYERSSSRPRTGATSDWDIWATHLDGTNNHLIGSGGQVAVSRDGKKIAFLGGPYATGLWVMNVDGSLKKKIYQYQDYQIYCARFSPDGRYIYFRIGGKWGDIFVIETEGANRTPVIQSEHVLTLHSVMPSPVSQSPISEQALEFGEKQVESMVRDRPEMGRYVHKGDPIWQYCVRQFAGEAIGECIAWNNTLPEQSEADHHIPYNHQMGFIRVRISDRNHHRAQTCEALWSQALFELCNIRSFKQHIENWEAALDGKIDKQEWIKRSTQLEYQASEYNAYICQTLWKPNMDSKGISTTPYLWQLDIPGTYEQWIALYTDRNDYPWIPFGKQYDEIILPYLRQSGKGK